MQAPVVDSRFRLIAPLGAGGMGEVYQALDTATGLVLALKIVPRSIASDVDLAAEFEIAARLRHPNIVRIFDYGRTPQGEAYFTMEYLPGVDLRTYLPEPDLSSLYRLTSQICDALAYLHGRGLLHGDLKPSNILVAGSGADA